MSLRRILAPGSLFALLCACAERPADELPLPPTELPAVGVAIWDTTGMWCAAIGADSLRPGDRLTIVYPDSSAPGVASAARVTRRRDTPCGSAFPQQSLADLPAYDLELGDGPRDGDATGPGAAIAVVGSASWHRGGDGITRSDLNGDGRPEVAEACLADEGEVFTVWHEATGGRPRERLWRGYFDWGVLVDANCPDAAIR